MKHKTLQGHLTNTKQSRVNSDAAEVLASSSKDVLKSTVFTQLPSKGRQWLFISDERRQRVPGMGSCSWKCTAIQGSSSRSWNDQCRHGSRPHATAKARCLNAVDGVRTAWWHRPRHVFGNVHRPTSLSTMQSLVVCTQSTMLDFLDCPLRLHAFERRRRCQNASLRMLLYSHLSQYVIPSSTRCQRRLLKFSSMCSCLK